MFNYLPEDHFAGLRLTCSDVNPSFLRRLRTRCVCETVIDDIEDSQLSPGWDAIAVVLVLEHVDWRRAVLSLTRLQPDNLLFIVQRNPADAAAAVTPGRTPPGTMAIFAEEAPPHLIPIDELIAELSGQGFVLHRVESRPVQDGKAMVGLALRKQRGSPVL
jgi:hypothetical protein